MRRRVAKVLSATIVAVTIAAFAEACLDATQITLRVTSNVPCEVSKGTSFSGGKLGTVERAKPNTVTMDCRDGEIGTLVATPSGDREVTAAFVVVQGVDRPVEECAANGYKGCIVQRRSVSYLPHTPLVLPIAMNLVCKDVACDEFTTCAKTGKCVSAALPDPERCENGECWPEGDGPVVIGGGGGSGDGDGGPGLEGSTTTDGASGDGSTTTSDGAPDDVTTAPPPPPPPPGALFCPPVPSGCAATGACCWSRTGTQGRCVSGTTCNADEMPMQCSRKSDCPASEYCCGYEPLMHPPAPPNYAVQRTYCAPMPTARCRLICVTSADCPPSSICDTSSFLFTPAGIFGECVTSQ